MLVDGGRGDLLDDFDPRNHLAEGGVVLVKVRAALAAEADEELTASRIRVRRTRHRKDALFVLAIVEFRLHRPTWSARTVAAIAATLDDEVRKNAVETGRVVKTLRSEFEEIRGVVWCDVVPKLNNDCALVGFD